MATVMYRSLVYKVYNVYIVFLNGWNKLYKLVVNDEPEDGDEVFCIFCREKFGFLIFFR